MKIYESSVKRPITTSLIFVAIIVFGLFSLSKLSIDLFPSFDMNQVMVIASYPGASAEDVETNVTKRLETTLSTVSDLKKITSTSKDNTSVVTIEFNWGTNLDAAVNDIRDKLELIKQALPDGCSTPMIFKLSTDMMPIVIYSVDAKESTAGLYKILDDNFSNPLQRIKGVGTVAIVGAPRREISVNVDPQKLEAYNLSVESIGSKIASENINTPAGNYDVGDETYSLRIEGEFKQSDLMKDIIVSDNGGMPVYLKDVATVRDSLQEKIQESYVNGKKGATIVVQKQNGANSVDVMNKINKALPTIKQNLPSDIHITEIMNTTDNIKKSVGSLEETILLAFLFVVIVVLYFLGQWRAIIIVLITIPVSLIGAFIYLYASGNTLNVISLSAISIAIGMVVDDAIVVLENVTQHIERGALPREAAIYGTNEVATAVIASTLTLLAVFFPFTMMSGLAGIMFKQLGWMVCIVMVVSILCALSLTPMLCSLLLKKRTNQVKDLLNSMLLSNVAWIALDNGYEKILSWAVRHKGKTITAAIILFVGSLLLMKVIGTEFVPASDNGQITGSIELPVGANVDRAKAVATRFQQEVKEKYPEIKNMTYTVGVPSDDESNAFSLMQSSGSNYISMRFRLSDLKERKRDIFEISDSLRNDLKQYPEISKFNISAGG
jgi:HAE1 family hydrophobic/amphiphilic exporter-1